MTYYCLEIDRSLETKEEYKKLYETKAKLFDDGLCLSSSLDLVGKYRVVNEIKWTTVESIVDCDFFHGSTNLENKSQDGYMSFGLEVFYNGKSNLLKFNSKKERDGFRKKATQKMRKQEKKLGKGAMSINWLETCQPEKYLKKLVEDWRGGGISTYEFILKINIHTNRSEKILRQWMVFPWVLKDYESEELNLENEEVYRNLEKPIGLKK